MICEDVDIANKHRFMFDLLWEDQNVIWSSKIGYGWIQSIVNFPLIVTKLYDNEEQMSWVPPPPLQGAF